FVTIFLLLSGSTSGTNWKNDILQFHSRRHLIRTQLYSVFLSGQMYILIISVLGIFLNVFVLMVFWLHKKACTVAEIYLSNLAAADLFLMSPFPILAVIAVTKYDLHLSETVCKLVPFSVNINVYCSIIILALVSIDRYLALVHPLTSGRMRRPFYAKVACVLVEVVHDSEGNFTTCDLNFPSPSMYLVFQGIRVFTFIIPTFLISFCTLRIIHALSGTLKKELNAQKKEQKATTLVLVVLLAFLICWMPTYMVSILYLLSGVNILNGFILTSLALSNSVLNPILYVILGTNFQTKVKELFMQMSTNLSNRQSGKHPQCHSKVYHSHFYYVLLHSQNYSSCQKQVKGKI
uniref:Bradykinin receptor B2 n=1 Tax=Amphiprion percula TaxID=161767 RepID=A0A3P8TFE7_AMPPE